MKLKLILVQIVIFALALTSCIDEPDFSKLPTGVYGKVTDLNGAELEGVSVTLDGKTIITDIIGLYLFDGLSAANYTLTFEKENYFTNTVQVTVTNGDIVTKNVILVGINDINDEMIYAQGGTFQMGSNDGDSDEQPIHTVTLEGFLIGKYEVTQREWEAVMGSNPSHFNGDNLPVDK